MHGNYRHRGEGRIFAGLILLALGVILLLGNLDIFQIRFELSRWWPVILIVIGIKHIVLWRGRSPWVASLFWIGTGVLFLSSTLGYLDAALPRLIWPVMLIWFGVLIVLGPFSAGRRTTRNGSES